MAGKLVFFLLACFLAVSTEKVRYDNYKVFKVIPQTVEELKVLNLVRTIGIDAKFWNEPTKIDSPVLIMVAPESVSEFEKFMHENKITAEMVIPNVQKLISEEERRMAKASKDIMDWEEYHTLDEINDWMRLQATDNRNFHVDRIEVGESFEGRKIYGLHIKNIASKDVELPGVILESGIHAREWIGPAASSYVINEILKDGNKDSVWHKFQYIYIPTINPDGYEYTFRQDRTWRKSRKPFLGGLCVGADLNRNWDSHWMSAGASSNPCLEDYAGPAPFSEIETASISEYYGKLNETYKGKFDVYIAFHSFAQLLMYPWGYTNEPTELTEVWNEVAGNATKELTAVHGTQYDYGNIHDTIYPASGSSIEYFYEKFNSFFTFVFELRDTGEFGFLLPSDQIIPTGEELKAALEYMLNNYVERKKSEEV